MTDTFPESLTLCPECTEWQWDSNEDGCKNCGTKLWNAFLNKSF